MRDPILIGAFLSLGVCLTRAMIDAAGVVPLLCARCLRRFERKEAGEEICVCGREHGREARAAADS